MGKWLSERTNTFAEKVSWRMVIIATVLFIMFIAFVLPKVSEYSAAAIGVAESPDTALIYTAQDLYELAESYGEAGRSTYILLRWTFDVAWPLVYAFFVMTLTMQLAKSIQHRRWPQYLYLIAFWGMVFDYLENLGTTVVMARYPLESGLIAELTPFFSLLKWGLIGASFTTVFVLGIIVLNSKLKRA